MKPRHGVKLQPPLPRLRDSPIGVLNPRQIAALLEEYYPGPPEELVAQLSAYLDLLLKWNARTNLTAIRDPEEIVRRHFGESLFTARHLPDGETLLDLGSGAGFPGLPIQLARPELRVTLAESQGKKASFLREAVRTLALPTEVWGDRVEAMPANRLFDVVTLRAVDNPVAAIRLAAKRLLPDGAIVHLTTQPGPQGITLRVPGGDRLFLHCFTPPANPA
jgi:16S rRNA (guanine527-N7)-methyltransferase